MPSVFNLVVNSLTSTSASGTFEYTSDATAVQGRTDQTGDTLSIPTAIDGVANWNNTGLAPGVTVRLDVWCFAGSTKSAELSTFYTTTGGVTASTVGAYSGGPTKSIQWTITGLSHPVSDYDSFRVSTSDGKSVTWSDGTNLDFTNGHSCGTTVTGNGFATYLGIEYPCGSSSVFTETCPIRPSNFSWTSPKTPGADFNITASEWGGFQSKINAFRVYRSFSPYPFTTVSTGNDFTATHYNEAQNAIFGMTSSAPPIHNIGEDILASDLNGLRDALNSVT